MLHHICHAEALKIKGRHINHVRCCHCEKAVTRAVKHLDPEAEVSIDRAANTVQVQSTLAREPLIQAFAEEGCPVAS